MSMKKFTYASMIIAALVTFKCDKDIECADDSFAPVNFETFGYSNINNQWIQSCTLQNIDVAQVVERSIIIRNQLDFDNFVVCLNSINVDFENQTVLAGARNTPGGSYVKDAHVSRKCNEYLYHIDIGETPSLKPSTVYYFVIVPRIAASSHVTFQVTVN
jgi:hypothetical protein